MKCNICGREYVALGVHIRLKHQIDPDDYRDEYGILRTTPLVDPDLSDAIRKSANARLLDEDYRQECVEACKANGAAMRGKPGFGMTKQGKEALANRNAARDKVYKWWIIDGVRYRSSAVAALALGIDQAEVVRRCNGYKRRGKTYGPRAGWYFVEVQA